MFQPLTSWPPVSRNPEALDYLRPAPYLSLDWEWNLRTGEPTILGASDGTLTVSCQHELGKPRLLALLERFPDARILGHNFIQADLSVMQRENIPVRLEQIEDTIIYHYLTNMSLCKSSKKVDDEEGEKRGRGFMNLWSFCGFYTDASNWKDCRGEGCEGPCPVHDVFGYNGQDAYWPTQAFPKVLQRARLMGVDKLYPLHRDVANVLRKMSERGVFVDVPYVEKLRGDFQAECEHIRKQLPFNPNSPKQVVAHFKQKGIALANAQEDTIRDAAEDNDDPELNLLLDEKELGNGPDRWFAPRKFNYDKNKWEGYVDDDGFIHSSIVFFTSTGRLASFNPNLQNVAIRRVDRTSGESIGKRIRRAVIAPDGYYLYRADFQSAEYRTYLTLAGYEDIPNEDFHTWMSQLMDIKPDDPLAISLGGPRQAAKSVVFSTLYLEGLKLVEARALNKPKMQVEIRNGARLVFPDWKVWDKIVTFTGINLANRALGGASYENRRRALEIAERFFARFPKTRDLQRAITRQVERDRCVRPPTGYVKASYGWQEEQLKAAAAMWGCLSPETPVLKSDLTWCENGNLKVGDELIGIEENSNGPRHRRLLPSIVESLNPVVLPAYRIITDKGEVIASAEHPWLVVDHGRSLRWLSTKELLRSRTGPPLKNSRKIAFLGKPWVQNESYANGYLAAAFDGEGTTGDKRLSFYQTGNPMLLEVIRLLEERGVNFYVPERHRAKPHYKVEHRIIVGGLYNSLRLAGEIQPKRIGTRILWENKHPFCGNGRYTVKARVLAVEAIGNKTLVGMTTSTRTFVANGLFTHNSNPVAHAMKYALLRMEQDERILPRLTVHDETLCYVDCRHEPSKVKEWITEAMSFNLPEIPKLKLPVEVSYGRSWADQKAIE